MGELLDLARQLRPTALDDHGLVAALAHPRARATTGAAPARASFWADPAARRAVRRTSQVVVYRVAQEALVNAARHSGATPHRGEPRAAATSRVSLQVADNGSGFAFAEEGKGLGLSGMRERALLVGGRLEIDSRPGKGTTVGWRSADAATGGDGAAADEAA